MRAADSNESKESTTAPEAKAFSACALLNSLPRRLLHLDSQLGHFARSIRRQRGQPKPRTASSSTDAWPMPPPYPEAFRETSDNFEVRARKRAVNSIVIGLSFLHLRGEREAPRSILLGTRLSSRQWSVVRRIEKMLEAWIIHPLVTTESMGRSAAKVDELESVLAQLQEIMVTIEPLGPYVCQPVSEKLKPGREPSEAPQRLGKQSSNLGSTFKQLDPDRISFVGEPSFNPAPYLDRRGREIFLEPLKKSLKPEEFFGALPAVQVHIVDGKLDKFLELLDASGRLALFKPSEVRWEFLSGIFAVGKDCSKDRMILDSRRPNCLEEPLGRWIRSLASSEGLCRLQLQRGEVLRFSGNDVRDFYHLFSVTRERALRNGLNILVPEAKCRKLRAYHREEHQGSRKLVPALNTLAMGDCQAVELAQTCHLSLVWRRGILRPRDTLTLAGPPPRSRVFGGVLIDDFVCGEKCPQDDRRGEPTAGASTADRLSEAYVAEGLIPHPGKAFRDQLRASFWGADVDGESGLVRGSLQRAIPLLYVLERVLNIGAVTPNLLQVITGSLISLFIYKRRLLSLLEEVFAVVQHHEADEILLLGPALRNELMLSALLLPLAVTNIRAEVLPEVCATDASGWGEAEVAASIPATIAQEAVRHSLRKSVWTRLLAPTQALARLHGQLDASAELPDEHVYCMHPLWEILVRSLEYRLKWKARSSRVRHINISELRAFLRSERRQGTRRPESRCLRASDSQVVLGCVQKGRSSSKALNRELRQSIPNIIGNDVYSESFYVDTRLNPADDPTRGAVIRGPSLQLPHWWDAACRGDFAELDFWLDEVGQSFSVQWGIPDPSELLGPDWDHAQAGASTRQSTEGRGSSEERSSGKPLDLNPSLPQIEQLRGEPSHIAAESKLPSVRSSFDAALTLCLQSFKSSHFVWPRSRENGERAKAWDFTQRGYLDLFSGARGVAKVVSATADTWCLCIDISQDPELDLLDSQLREKLEFLIKGGVFFAVGCAPVCGSFSVAVTPPVRDGSHPGGKPGLTANMEAKVRIGNSLSAWIAHLAALCLELQFVFWVENPQRSWLWRQSEWVLLRDDQRLGFWESTFCAFGAPWKKATRVLTNCFLRHQRNTCPGCPRHFALRGYSIEFKRPWTKVAEAYPKRFSKYLGWAVAVHFGDPSSLLVKLNVAECAKVSHSRIGEAKGPGPRAPRGQAREPREMVLDDIKLISPTNRKASVKDLGKICRLGSRRHQPRSGPTTSFPSRFCSALS